MTHIDGYIEGYDGGVVYDDMHMAPVQLDSKDKLKNPVPRKDGKIKVWIMWDGVRQYAQDIPINEFFSTRAEILQHFLDDAEQERDRIQRHIFAIELALQQEDGIR